MNKTPIEDKQTKFPIVLLDIETTGLCWDESSVILEIGMGLLSSYHALVEQKSWVVYQPRHIINDVSPWIRETHGANGLLNESNSRGLLAQQVERECVRYLVDNGFKPGEVLVAGNSVWTDRVHLRRHMPGFENWFCHRHLDFSSVATFCQIFNKDMNLRKFSDDHRALAGLESALLRFRQLKMSYA